MNHPPTAPNIIVYGHPTCPGIGPLKGMLAQSDVAYDYIDIQRDADAAARVRMINNGYESVPTLVFPDGSTLTEPSVGELKTKLEALGYRVGLLAWLTGHLWHVVIVAGVLLALLRILTT